MTVFIPDRILEEQITGEPTLAVSTPFVLTVLLPFLVYGNKPPLYAPALVNNSGGNGLLTLICGILTSNCRCTPTFLCTQPTFTFPDAEYGFKGVFVVVPPGATGSIAGVGGNGPCPESIFPHTAIGLVVMIVTPVPVMFLYWI
jgi:hypothetical protein